MRAAAGFSWVAAALAALAAAGCGSGSSGNPSGFYVSISGMSFSPLNLDAPPGATVTIINNDSMAHSVTSEAIPDSFTHGGAIPFDTGAFTGQASFTLPTTAPAGTVLNYFCAVHKGTMATRNGTITVRPDAAPSPPPGGMPPGHGY